jgi:hypothetical protein
MHVFSLCCPCVPLSVPWGSASAAPVASLCPPYQNFWAKFGWCVFDADAVACPRPPSPSALAQDRASASRVGRRSTAARRWRRRTAPRRKSRARWCARMSTTTPPGASAWPRHEWPEPRAATGNGAGQDDRMSMAMLAAEAGWRTASGAALTMRA